MRTQKNFSSREQQLLKKKIFEKTGYHIRSNGLLLQTFTRSTYSAEHGGENNEVLEFIGDQVMAYYLVKVATSRCVSGNSRGEYAFRIREDRFTAIKHEVVSNETLAEIIDEWGIGEYLIVGGCDYGNKEGLPLKAKADLFEAILGAIALESKWDPAVLEIAVSGMLSMEDRVIRMLQEEKRPPKFDIQNAPRILKELSDHRECTPPSYRFAGPESMGYDEDGDPIWSCTCQSANLRETIYRRVSANSKKDAKKAAAYLVLCAHFELPDGQDVDWKFQKGNLISAGQ